jgi:hypothetical protein
MMTRIFLAIGLVELLSGRASASLLEDGESAY